MRKAPWVLDAGQYNDSCSWIQIAQALAKAFNTYDRNFLIIIYDRKNMK